MGLTVVHERWKCIACGACAAVEPDEWEMKPDTFASIKKALTDNRSGLFSVLKVQ